MKSCDNKELMEAKLVGVTLNKSNFHNMKGGDVLRGV